MDIGLQSIYFKLKDGMRMVLTPLPRLGLERQMLGDKDCLSAESASSAVITQMQR